MHRSTLTSRRTLRTAALGVAAATALLVTGCGQSAQSAGDDTGDSGGSEETLTFAAVPGEASQELQSSYENVIELLEQETGRTVEFQNATDYASVVEGQRAGQIDIASYGPFAYILAADGGVPAEPIAGLVDAPDQQPAYTSLAYVPADSEIDSLEDLQGKNVCFVDAASTSGYLVPSKGLLDAGIDPEQDVEPVMAGGHDASLLSTLSGQCDVGFGHDTIEQSLVDGGQIQEGDLRAIWESEPIPEDPIAISTDTVDEQTRQRIATALTAKANKPALVEAGICESEEDCVLPEEAEWGYVGVQDADYDPVREVCEVTQAEACSSI